MAAGVRGASDPCVSFPGLTPFVMSTRQQLSALSLSFTVQDVYE